MTLETTLFVLVKATRMVPEESAGHTVKPAVHCTEDTEPPRSHVLAECGIGLSTPTLRVHVRGRAVKKVEQEMGTLCGIYFYSLWRESKEFYLQEAVCSEEQTISL